MTCALASSANDTTSSRTYTLNIVANRMEQAGVAFFQVVRAGDLEHTSTLYFKTYDGTMIAGTDYTGIASQTLNWAVGETSKLVAVNLIANANKAQSLTLGGFISEDSTFSDFSTAGTDHKRTETVFDATSWTAAAGATDVITLGTTLGTYKGGYVVDTSDGNDTVTMVNAPWTYTSIKLGAGTDTLASGTGNSATNFINGSAHYDGGAGVDTMKFQTANTFDFIGKNVNQLITGFEILDMKTDVANQIMNLSLQDVVDLTTGNTVVGTLRISGAAGDVLNLQALGKTLSTLAASTTLTDVDGTDYTVAGSSAGNALTSDVTIGGFTYDVYQYTHDAHALTLLVATAVTTNII